MSIQPTLTLVSSQKRVAVTKRRLNRYSIDIYGYSGPAPLIVVTDRVRRRTILQWHGSIARQLLESDRLPLVHMKDGQHDCDKQLLQRLAMAGAAATARLSDYGATAAFSTQVIELEEQDAMNVSATQRRSALHGCLTRLLEEFPKQHLAEEDIICLMQFRMPCLSNAQIRAALDDLTTWKRVQRIAVPGASVHYDLDTRPHLHFYDPETRELRDAPGSGVVTIT